MRARRAAGLPAPNGLQAVADGAFVAGDRAWVLAAEVVPDGVEQPADEDQDTAQVVPVQLAQLGEQLAVDCRGSLPGRILM